MNDPLAARLEQIETHLAHLERQFDELNSVVIDQARAIKKLQTQQLRLADTVETTELERIKDTNPKPPHHH